MPEEVPQTVETSEMDAPPIPMEPAAPPTVFPGEEGKMYWGTGRRKSSVARVRIKKGTGEISINKRSLSDYFPRDVLRQAVLAPLEKTHLSDQVDVIAKTTGGGMTGQAGAVMLGIARAMIRTDPAYKGALQSFGLLTRDPRMKERKKYGQRGARRRFQFSKR